jgi:hypothetical protein
VINAEFDAEAELEKYENTETTVVYWNDPTTPNKICESLRAAAMHLKEIVFTTGQMAELFVHSPGGDRIFTADELKAIVAAVKHDHRGVTYDVHRLDDGRWEWVVYPKVGEGGRFAGLEDDEGKAFAAAKTGIDQWLREQKDEAQATETARTGPSNDVRISTERQARSPPQISEFKVSAGEYKIQGNDADLIVRHSSTTAIVAAVRTNQLALKLAAISLLASLDAKLEQLREARSNSEDPALYEDLKRRVEEFLAASASNDEVPVIATTLSLADGLRNWWIKDHSNICSKALNLGLFAGGLVICGLAGALGTVSVVTIGALVGGKDVASALEACVKVLKSN